MLPLVYVFELFQTVQLGRFKLKSNSDDESSDISAGSFFQKRMNLSIDNKQLPKPSLAATARSTDSPKSSQVFKTKAEPSHSSKKISVSSDRRQEVLSALMRGSPVPSKTSVSSETENKPKNITTPIVKRYKPEEVIITTTDLCNYYFHQVYVFTFEIMVGQKQALKIKIK